MNNWLRKWGEEHCEGGLELNSREAGEWELSIWLDWTCFALGLDVQREYGSPSWPDRWHCSLAFGPISFGAMRTWNERQP